MGEDRGVRHRMLQQLASLDPHPESVPINLLVRVEGTPLAGLAPEDPLELVRTIATARILMPASFVRLECRASVADRRGAGALLPGRRQLRVPRRSAADDAESRARATTSGCSRNSACASPPARAPPSQPPLMSPDGADGRSTTGFAARLTALGAQTACCERSGRRPASISPRTTTCSCRHIPVVVSRFADAVRASPAPAAPARACCAANARASRLERRFAAFKGTDGSLLLLVRLSGEPGGADHAPGSRAT